MDRVLNDLLHIQLMFLRLKVCDRFVIENMGLRSTYDPKDELAINCYRFVTRFRNVRSDKKKSLQLLQTVGKLSQRWVADIR